MPHVLEELQGVPTAVYETHTVNGEEKQVIARIETDTAENSARRNTTMRLGI